LLRYRRVGQIDDGLHGTGPAPEALPPRDVQPYGDLIDRMLFHVPEEQQEPVGLSQVPHTATDLCAFVEGLEESFAEAVRALPSPTSRSDLEHGRGWRLPPIRVGDETMDNVMLGSKHTNHQTDDNRLPR